MTDFVLDIQDLRANGMERYDEYAMLIKNQGRSCQDEFYLEQMGDE